MDVMITLPDTLLLGRNGRIGTLPVDWAAVPRHVMDHIGRVYYAQYITDKANSGGADIPMAERFALAEKKLAAMYRGDIRVRSESAEPADPIERLVFVWARDAAKTHVESMPEYATTKGKNRHDTVLAAYGTDLESVIAMIIENNPEWRDKAADEIARETERKNAAVKAMMPGLVKKAK